MSTPAKLCPTCRAALPADAPAGLCPQCLLNPDVIAAASDTLMATAAPSVSPSSVRLRYFGDYELIDEIARGGMASFIGRNR
jgi:hypothetical protein